MRVTKALIEEIVKTEAEKHYGPQIRQSQNGIRTWATNHVRNHLPAEILIFWDNAGMGLREFIRNTNACHIQYNIGAGQFFDYFDLLESLPGAEYRHSIIASPLMEKEIALLQERKDFKREYIRELQTNLTAYQGKSTKRLLEDLPELSGYVKEVMQNNLVSTKMIERTRDLLKEEK